MIGRRRRNQDARLGGVAVGIQTECHRGSNPWPLSGQGTVSGGQFGWGGRLPKRPGGAQKRLGEIIVPVKMQVTRDRTERPRGALL